MVQKFWRVKEIEDKKLDICLVVTGDILKITFIHHKDLFTELILQCNTVICCRVTPFMKASIVHLMKKKTGKICLGIGDGANDVRCVM